MRLHSLFCSQMNIPFRYHVKHIPDPFYTGFILYLFIYFLKVQSKPGWSSLTYYKCTLPFELFAFEPQFLITFSYLFSNNKVVFRVWYPAYVLFISLCGHPVLLISFAKLFFYFVLLLVCRLLFSTVFTLIWQS